MHTRKERGQMMEIVGILVIVALVVGGALAVWAAETVPYGHVRLVTRWGELTGEVLEPGLSFITPIAEGTVQFSTQVQSYETSDNPDTSEADFTDYPVTANTADGQQIVVKYTVLFHVASDKALDLAHDVGRIEQIVENVVKAHSRNKARVLAQDYQAEDLFSGTGIAHYQQAVLDSLIDAFVTTGLTLDDFLVRKIEFDLDYINTIEQQQIAQEQIQTAEFQAQAAVYEAERRAALAQGDADAAVVRAEGDAKAVVLAAEAQAESIRLLADAEAYRLEAIANVLEINPQLIQWEFVTQLDNVTWGILPGDGISMFLPVPNAPANPD